MLSTTFFFLNGNHLFLPIFFKAFWRFNQLSKTKINQVTANQQKYCKIREIFRFFTVILKIIILELYRLNIFTPNYLGNI